MGHPKPFGLTMVAVGNEENLPDAFFARFTQFRAAIEARYPTEDLHQVENRRALKSGPAFSRTFLLLLLASRVFFLPDSI